MKRLVLEMTRTSLRALVVEGVPLRPRIRAVAVEPSAGEPPVPMLRRLAGLAASGRAEVISVLPRDQIITRLQKFPATRPDELAQMVQLLGKTQLPYPPEQTAVTFQVIEQHGGMSSVQIVACHRDVIQRQLELLRQAGVEPAVLTPSSWALAGWYQRFGRSVEAKEPALVVNIDADRTDLVVMREGRALFSRSLSQGEEDWRSSAQGIGLLAEEVERTLSSLRKEWVGLDAGSLVLTGVGALVAWKESLSQRTGKPVFVRPATGTLKLPEGSAALSGASATASLAVMLGAAMAERSGLVDLLPRTTRHAQAQRRLMVQIMGSTALLMAALVLGAGWLSTYVQRRVEADARSRAAIRALESTGRELKRKDEEVRWIEELQAARRWAARMLSALFEALSDEIRLEQVVVERARGEVIVRGSAPTTRHVLDYLGRLEQAKHWERVELRYAESRGQGTAVRTDFEVLLRGTL